MEIDGNVEFLGSRKEGPVGLVVIEMALVVIVDQGPDEAELLHTSRQLIRCGCRIRQRDGRPATKPQWMLLNCRCQNIVGILAFRKIVGTGTNGHESRPNDSIRTVYFGINYDSQIKYDSQTNNGAEWKHESCCVLMENYTLTA